MISERVSRWRWPALTVAALLALLAVGVGTLVGLSTPAAEAQQSTPGAPATATVARSVDYLDASWTAPTDAGSSSAITGYDVQVNGDAKTSWWRAVTGVNPTPVNGTQTYRGAGDVDDTIDLGTSVSQSTTVYVAVPAVNASGGGGWQDAGLVLGKPTLSVSDSGAASWSYTVPAGATFSSYELRWMLAWGRDADSWTGNKNKQFTTSGTTAHQIPQLDSGREYKAQLIVGVDVSGVTQYATSDTVFFTTPSLITKPTLSVSDTGVATWTYTPASGEILWEEIRWMKPGKQWYESEGDWTAASPYQIPNLDPDTNYLARLVVAVSDGGATKFGQSDPVAFTTPAIPKPTLSVSDAGVATWSYTTRIGEVGLAEVRWIKSGEDWADNLGSPRGIESPYQLIELESSTQYQAKLIVAVSVSTDDGDETTLAESDAVTFTTPASPPSGNAKPTLSVSASGTATWSYSLPPSATLIEYELRWVEDSGSADYWDGYSSQTFTSTGASSHSMTGLEKGKAYKVKLVAAANLSGGKYATESNVATLNVLASGSSLTATVDADWSVDLTLANAPANWWYKIGDDGSCVAVSGATASDISGIGAGTHSVSAYSDSGCANKTASGKVTVVKADLWTKTNSDWSVDLLLADGPANWWYKVGSGSCTAASGTAASDISYGLGESISAYSDSGCAGEISGSVSIAHDATLTATVAGDGVVDLALSDGPANWWYKIDEGSCVAASGSSASGISVSSGERSVSAYADSGCGGEVANATFVVPGLAATVNDNVSVDLALSNGPANWWFQIGGHFCTPVAGTTISGISGYQAGSYNVKAYSDSDCVNQIANTTFTVGAITLSATVEANLWVDLALSNGPANWWYKIDEGNCSAAASGTTIGGLAPGNHSAKAYSNSSCANQIANTTFTIVAISLSATVNDDNSVDLTLSDGPTIWWFRINYGTCTKVVGTTISGISGYQPFNYDVKAYSNMWCGSQIASTTFKIAGMWSTVNDNLSVDLTLTHGPANWWYKIGEGDCAAASGSYVNGITGYQPGNYTVKAYSDSSCANQIANTTFTIVAITLSATVDSNVWVDLELSNGPDDWWFKIGSGNCTLGSWQNRNGITGIAPGNHAAKAYSDSSCANQIAETTFTIVAISLSATVQDDSTVDLTLSNGPASWWFRIGAHSCTPVSGSTFNGVGGYLPGSYNVKAYRDSGCSHQVGNTTSFTIPHPAPNASLSATVNGNVSVDLTLSDGPDDWWFRIGGGNCTPVDGTTISGIGGYPPGSYNAKAYSDSGCAFQIAETSYTISAISLSATVNDNVSVDLTLSDGPDDWWFRIGSGTCTPVNGTTISGIGGYPPGNYNAKAYSNSGCSNQVAETTYTIIAISLSATVRNDGKVDLTLSDGPDSWWFKIGSGTCTPVSGTKFSGIGGYPPGDYNATAYSDSGCSNQVAATTYTIPTPDTNASLSATVDGDGKVDLTLSDGPSNWWFRIGNGTCTPVSGTTISGISGYQAGNYNVKAYSDNACAIQIAETTYTIP